MSVTTDPRPSRRVSGLRIVALFGLMAGLLGSLYLQRSSIHLKQLEKQQAIEAETRAQSMARPPLDRPDFLGGPEFDVNGSPDQLLKSLYRTANSYSLRAEALKLKKKVNRSGPYLSVPNDPELMTEGQRLDRYFEYRLRELEAYRNHTADQGEAREAGETFLLAYLEFVCGRENAQSSREVDRLGQAALAAGTVDPMIRTYAAYQSYLQNRDGAAATRVWNETVTELSQSKYPRIVLTYLRQFAYDVNRDMKGSRHSERSEAFAVSIVQWLEEESSDSDWIDCALFRLIRLRWSDYGVHRLAILKGCLESSRIDPVIRHTLAGLHLYSEGFRIRGSGYAHEVDPQAWGPFRDHLRQAKAHLQYAWMLRPDLPYAASQMIGVTNANPDATYSCYDWFLRSCEAQVDHWPSYSSLLSSLRPRWGGSLADMFVFSQKCLESDRFDTVVPYALIRILLDIDVMEFEEDPAKWDSWNQRPAISLFLQKREDYRSKHPEQDKLYGDTPYYRTRLGVLLEKWGFHEAALAEFEAANGNLDFSFLQLNNRSGAYLLKRLHAAQGDSRERVLTLDQKLRTRWPTDTPAEIFEQLQEEIAILRPSAQDQTAREYFDQTAQMASQLRQFAVGEWVDLTLANGGPVWEIFGGEFDADNHEDELILDVSNSPWRKTQGDSVSLRPLVNFTPPFEMEILADVGESGEVGMAWRRPEVVASHEWSPDEVYVGASGIDFASFSSGTQFGVLNSWTRNTGRRSHLLACKLWPMYVESTMDGSWSVVTLEEPLREDGVIHLVLSLRGSAGNFPSQSNPVDAPADENVSISHVRIRRLSNSVPPTEFDQLDAREAYWRFRATSSPNDLIAQIRLCELLLDLEQYDDVIKHVDQILSNWSPCDRVRCLRARALLLSGRHRAALEDLLLAFEETEDPFTILTMAELEAATPLDDLRNGERAISRSIQALKYHEQRTGITETSLASSVKAAAYAELGDFERARTENLRAIDLAPNHRIQQRLKDRQKLYEADFRFRLPLVEDQSPVSAIDDLE